MSPGGPPLTSWSTRACGNLPEVRSIRPFSAAGPLGVPALLVDVPASERGGRPVRPPPPLLESCPWPFGLEPPVEQPKGNTPATKTQLAPSVDPIVLVRRLVMFDACS